MKISAMCRLGAKNYLPFNTSALERSTPIGSSEKLASGINRAIALDPIRTPIVDEEDLNEAATKPVSLLKIKLVQS